MNAPSVIGNSFPPPALLPKVRSKAVLGAVRGMPCTLRIATFVPGHRCADPATVVPCHVGNLGKGMSTKVSDLSVAAGCMACHDLLDGRDSRRAWLIENYPAAVQHRALMGVLETQAMLLMRGALIIPDAEFY